MNENLMKHGAFGWTEPMTADVAAARAFCGALFGWETEDCPGGGYVPVKVGGETVGGMMATPPERAARHPRGRPLPRPAGPAGRHPVRDAVPEADLTAAPAPSAPSALRITAIDEPAGRRTPRR